MFLCKKTNKLYRENSIILSVINTRYMYLNMISNAE